MPAPDTNVGAALAALIVPSFTHAVVDGQTWRPRDITKKAQHRNHLSKVAAKTYNDAGKQISCTWVIKSGSTPSKIGDIVIGTYASGTPTTREFTVEECEDMPDECGAHVQNVTLEHHDGLDLTP